jgi:hypothetical protein
MLPKLEEIEPNDGPTIAIKNFIQNTCGGICPSDW